MARRRRRADKDLWATLIVGIVAGAAWLVWQVLTLLWRGVKALVALLQSNSTAGPVENLRQESERVQAPRTPGQWIRAGQAVRMQGYLIPGGMIYVGEVMPAVSGVATEPALVVPSLSVASGSPNTTGTGVPYWPSYSSISPASRAAYLAWLASGRRDPSAYIGYVFLFFYGLERRALFDGPRLQETEEEIRAIAAETRALLATYGRNRSFAGYASRFLDACAFMLGDESLRGQAADCVRQELATLARDGKPVQADTALRVAMATGEYGRSGALVYCPDEYQRLFRIRFAGRYPRGLAVRASSMTAFRYQPATQTFGGALRLNAREVMQVRSDELAETLRPLAQSCQLELQPYAMSLARDPSTRGSIHSVALLPRELGQEFLGGQERAVREWLSAVTANGPFMIAKTELLRRWPGPLPRELTRRNAIELSRGLEWLGFGLEPDIRFDAPCVEKAEKIVLFSMPAGHMEAPSPEYATGMLMSRLGVVIAAADGAAAPQELSKLTEMLESKLTLDPAERTRLAAHTMWLAGEGTSLVGLNKKLAGLGAQHRQAIADVAAAVALVDGKITREESARLEKVYQLLGLDAGRVFDDLHAMGVSGPDGREGMTPLPPKLATGEELDMVRVQAKIAESSAVAAMLKDIFVEDEPAPAVPVADVVQAGLAGLDGAHSGLLRRLRDVSVVGRAQWEDWCQSMRLLPDGAVDRLNEAALDLCGEPLLDGDDPIEIAPTVLKEMLQ